MLLVVSFQALSGVNGKVGEKNVHDMHTVIQAEFGALLRWQHLKVCTLCIFETVHLAQQ